MIKSKNRIFFSIFKNIIVIIIYWMNKSCWPVVNNCWLNWYFWNLQYTRKKCDFSLKIYEKNKWNKILYILICILIPTLLTMCWPNVEICWPNMSTFFQKFRLYVVSLRFQSNILISMFHEFFQNLMNFHFLKMWIVKNVTFRRKLFFHMSLISSNLLLFWCFCYENIRTD